MWLGEDASLKLVAVSGCRRRKKWHFPKVLGPVWLSWQQGKCPGWVEGGTRASRGKQSCSLVHKYLVLKDGNKISLSVGKNFAVFVLTQEPAGSHHNESKTQEKDWPYRDILDTW